MDNPDFQDANEGSENSEEDLSGFYSAEENFESIQDKEQTNNKQNNEPSQNIKEELEEYNYIRYEDDQLIIQDYSPENSPKQYIDIELKKKKRRRRRKKKPFEEDFEDWPEMDNYIEDQPIEYKQKTQPVIYKKKYNQYNDEYLNTQYNNPPPPIKYQQKNRYIEKKPKNTQEKVIYKKKEQPKVLYVPKKQVKSSEELSQPNMEEKNDLPQGFENKDYEFDSSDDQDQIGHKFKPKQQNTESVHKDSIDEIIDNMSYFHVDIQHKVKNIPQLNEENDYLDEDYYFTPKLEYKPKQEYQKKTIQEKSNQQQSNFKLTSAPYIPKKKQVSQDQDPKIIQNKQKTQVDVRSAPYFKKADRNQYQVWSPQVKQYKGQWKQQQEIPSIQLGAMSPQPHYSVLSSQDISPLQQMTLPQGVYQTVQQQVVQPQKEIEFTSYPQAILPPNPHNGGFYGQY